MLRDAIPTVGGDDDGPPLAHHLRGGTHALHRLVQIEVQWVTRIGGDHDVEGMRHTDHGRLSHKVTAGCVGRVQVSGKDAGDLLLLVKCHIHQEIRAYFEGHLTYFLPDWVTPGDSPGGLGMADHPGVVVAQHRPLASHARHQRLATPRETGKQVRFDKPGYNFYVTAPQGPVNPHLETARRYP